MKEPKYFYAYQLADSTVNNTILTSADYRNGQAGRAVTVAVLDALGVIDDPMLPTAGRNLENQVFYTSERHGAPWVRNEKVVDALICTLPANITDQLAQSEYFTTNYGNGADRINAGVIVPNYDYTLPEWRT